MGQEKKNAIEVGNTSSKVEKSAREAVCIVLNGTLYAVGLVWQPLQDPDSPLSEIQIMTESDPEFDLYCLRTGSAPQYGLGKSSIGQSAGMPALAISVASYFTDDPSVCAMFRVPEGWWLLVIRNDLILSEEDVLFKDEDEAKKAFFSILEVPDWNRRIAPKEWNIPDTETLSLEELVKNTKKVRLIELTTVKKTQFLITVAAIVCLLIGVIIFVFSSFLEVFNAEPISKTEPKMIPIKPTQEITPKTWTKIPQTEIYIKKCWNNIYMLRSVIIPGWHMGTVICLPKGISMQWTAVGSGRNLALLEKALEVYRLEKLNIQVKEDGMTAIVSVPFTDIPFVEVEPQYSLKQIQHELLDIKQATGMNINFSQQQSSSKEGEKANKNEILNPFSYFDFNVSSGYTPWEWEAFFSKFSGVELMKITYNPDIATGDGKWSYEGRIYAK